MPIKIPAESQQTALEQLTNILKFIWKCEEPRIAEKFLDKKSKAGQLTLNDFKTYYKAT